MDISQLKLFATQPHPCSYLEGEQATTVFIDPTAQIDARIYSELSDFGFRRSGSHLYRPHCQNCQACIPVRIPVNHFIPNRSQRRTAQRNADLSIEQISDIDTDEHYALYERYLAQRHADGDMYPPTRKQFTDFLCPQWGTTRYLEFRANQRLVAVAVTDRLDQGISAIYTFYDPEEERRSLGTFAILSQIEWARRAHLPFVYLGYWIKTCKKMRYKSAFRPLQLFVNQRWLTLS